MAKVKAKAQVKKKAKTKAKAQPKAKVQSAQAARTKKWFLVAVGGVVAAIIFLPTTVLLLVGMMPTAVAYLVDQAKEKLLIFIVGFMNFVGVLPFILRLWSNGQNMNEVSDIISDPLTIVIVYACAGMGYLIDWFVTDAASAFIVRRAKARMKAIIKQQEILVERWGREVNVAHGGIVDDEDDIEE